MPFANFLTPAWFGSGVLSLASTTGADCDRRCGRGIPLKRSGRDRKARREAYRIQLPRHRRPVQEAGISHLVLQVLKNQPAIDPMQR